MCGYTELRSGTLLLARHGSLQESVGFSICLPVVGPPQVRGRDIYVDGSFVDNLPVEALASMGEGPIIAVDVRASFGEARAGAERSAPAAATAVSERIPTLPETLTRVMLLGSSNTSEAARRHADLIIKPQPDGVGLLEFHQLDAALEAGRAAGRQALEDPPAWLFGSGVGDSVGPAGPAGPADSAGE
jgi:predicted acylesterase/phospholipase RssA